MVPTPISQMRCSFLRGCPWGPLPALRGRPRFVRGSAAIGLAVLAVLGSVRDGSAQTIRGMVYDETSGRALGGTSVRIFLVDLTPVLDVQADARGAYTVDVESAGRYVVVASRTGYATSPPEVVDIKEDETLNLLLNLRSLLSDRPDFTVSQAEIEGRAGFIYGQVVQHVDGSPVEQAEVHLTSLSKSVLTNQSGRFRFEEVDHGPTVIRVNHLSFEPQEHLVDVEAGVAYQVTVRMDVDPIEVAGIEVVARSRFVARRLIPVYERMDRKAFGFFSTTQDFVKRGNPSVAAMLQELPSTRVRSGRGLTWSIQLRGGCTPTIFVDGVRVGRGGVSEFLNMSTISVEIIEVFPGAASLPPEYNDPGTFCAIGIWTKRGG